MQKCAKFDFDAGSTPESSASGSDERQHQPSPQLPPAQSNAVVIDIGLAVDNRNVTDGERLQLLENEWVAPQGFQWPHTMRMDHGQPRRKYLGPQHFTGQYSCFRYSMTKQGVFCAPCVLFAADSVGGVKLDRLVKSPLQKFSHLSGNDGYLTTHLQNTFHEDCARRARAFCQMMRGRAGDVAQQVDTAAAVQRQQNRRALERIIQAIEFHGRLGLPLHGHRDYGELPLPDANGGIDYTQGNMRATLQLMMACNDEALKQHLATTGRNATYISPASQNQLIEAVAVVIRQHIVTDINAAKYFTIMADETTDFSRQEQLSVCLRYVKTSLFLRDFCASS